MLNIFVDADACPVKQEVYRVARRCGLEVTLVANSWMRVPDEPWLHLEVVGGGFDEADDWIADKVGKDDLVITGESADPQALAALREHAREVRVVDTSLGPVSFKITDAGGVRRLRPKSERK